jgi:hypothetical protein
MKSTTSSKDTALKKKESASPTNMITKDYADILVNQLLNTTESITILNASSKLKFYDQKLKEMGLRATVKIGIEKIEWA